MDLGVLARNHTAHIRVLITGKGEHRRQLHWKDPECYFAGIHEGWGRGQRWRVSWTSVVVVWFLKLR